MKYQKRKKYDSYALFVSDNRISCALNSLCGDIKEEIEKCARITGLIFDASSVNNILKEFINANFTNAD